jgi:hypothetical protein
LFIQAGGVIGLYKEVSPQYDLMLPGERYILFLIPDGRTGLPSIDGLGRYAVQDIWGGLFRIDGIGNVRTARATDGGLRSEVEGLAASEISRRVVALAAR